MALLALTGVSFTHGGPRILDGVSLQIEEGERLGLLGRNASGKSTLMALLAGEVERDGGDLARKQGLTVGRLPQEVPRGMRGSVRGCRGVCCWRGRWRRRRIC